jgi:hypothetical protein
MRRECSTNGEGKENLYNDFVENPDGRGPLERPTLRWEDNIKMDLREI